MRNLVRSGFLSLLMAGSVMLPAAQAAEVSPIRCLHEAPKIDEAKFVTIGGIEQWVTIKGASCANPVILFIHGGPGNPISPFAGALYGAWEKDFTLVQWDQRGAGATFGRNPEQAEAPLSIARMTQDGVELAAYLTKYLGKQKVILHGGSWGSVLAVHMAKTKPELFHAYVGVGQMVSYTDNQAATYQKVTALARAAGDAQTLSTVEALGAPPWTNPRNFGIVRRATRAYEAKTSDPAPKAWWALPAHYATPKMQADYEAGEEYSFLQFVGMKGNGMLSQVDLPKLGPRFEMPVYLVQGTEDLVTMPEVAQRYFDSIVAPRKEFISVPKAGHDPNVPLLQAQFDVLKKHVAPSAK